MSRKKSGRGNTPGQDKVPTQIIPEKTVTAETQKNTASPQVNQGRHEAQCSICKHAQRDEIEQQFLRWTRPDAITKTFGICRDSIYRHARAFDLLEPRRRNVRFALERVIERAGDVEVNANAVVSAVARTDFQGSLYEAVLVKSCKAQAFVFIFASSGKETVDTLITATNLKLDGVRSGCRPSDSGNK